MMLNVKIKGLFLLLTLILAVAPAGAEYVKALNPSCDVCPVVIAYNGQESRAILGEKGLTAVRNIEKAFPKKAVMIDIDGIKAPGPEIGNRDGYEIRVFIYPHLIVMSTIQDASALKIHTDYQNLVTDPLAWRPEIHLSPAKKIQINMTDSLEDAWVKFGLTRIHSHVNDQVQNAKWEEKLAAFIIENLMIAIEHQF